MKSIRIRSAAAALIVAGLATPAFASGNPASTTTNAAAATTAADNSSAADNRRICVRINLTGTRIERMQCRTRAEWLRTEGAVPGEER